jgi:DNA polymerase V
MRIRTQVRQWTGIPIGIGIGPTKTLAKLANRLAKRHRDFKPVGVCNLQDVEPWNRIRYFTEIDVQDIWGIGSKLSAKLRLLGIESAQDLKMANPEAMRQKFGVVMERTVRELNGISCIPLEDAPAPKKQIISSRSFGQLLTDPQHLAEAVASYAATAAQKLRGEGEVAGAIQVYLETNPFIPGEPQYHPATLIKFSNPTDDTARLIQAARAGLRRIYKKEFRYKKAGVMLLDLQPAGVHQGDLFSAELPNRAERRDRLMATMDTINSEMGKGTLRFVAEGVLMPWKMRRENLTAGYTTSWEQLALAK